MGFSVAQPPSTTTVMAEITLANSQAELEAEGLLLPQELVDPETMKNQGEQGTLKGENKQYTFTQQEKSALPEKLTDCLSDLNRPKEDKLLDPKSTKPDLQFKKSDVKEKEFKVLEPHKQHLDGKQKEQTPQTKMFTKTQQTAQKTLEKAPPPKAAPQKQAPASIKQQQHQAKTVEHKTQKELERKEQTREPKKSEAKKGEAKQTGHKQAPQELHQRHADKLDKNEEREQQEQQQKRDEEEGFAEQQNNQNQDQPDSQENTKTKTEKISDEFAQEFTSYGLDESILSQIFDMRVSQFDVLILFMEILKLEIRGREQERIGRQIEREMQIKYMQEVVANYKKQAQDLRNTSLGAGLMGIAAGLLPIAGFLKGDWILQKLGSIGSFFKNFQGQDPNKVFKNFAQMLSSGSEMQKTLGQVQVTFGEGERSYNQHMSDLYRSDWEESTRTMEEIKDSWKGIENFLYQSLQMHHDTIRQLYS